jgi:hypothetical protein
VSHHDADSPPFNLGAWPISDAPFASYDALLEAIRRMPEVPGRDRMRERKKPSEAWLAVRFAIALSGTTGPLAFPLAFEQGERPDLILQTPSGTIGVEITEAIHKQFSHSMSMAERMGLQVPDLSLFSYDHLYGREELAAILAGDVEGDGFTLKTTRIEWLAQVSAAINRKLDKPSSPGYRPADKQALLVYDNTGLFFKPRHAQEVLTELSLEAAGLAAFDTVSVLTGAVLLHMTRRAGRKECALYKLPSEIVR